MSERHFTAFDIVERNRAHWVAHYWACHREESNKLNEMLNRLRQKVLDIAFGRVRCGWPTREDAAPEENC